MKILFSKIFVKNLKDLSRPEILKILSIVSSVKKVSFPLKSKDRKEIIQVKGQEDMYVVRSGKFQALFLVIGKVVYFKDVGLRKIF